MMHPVSLAAALLALFPAGSQQQELPPVPRLLIDSAALVCARIDTEGRVDAYVLDSTGDTRRDEAVVAWVRQLRFPKGEASEPGRNIWFPMPVTFGKASAPKLPPSCTSQANRT